jgi:hypothetical protein
MDRPTGSPPIEFRKAPTGQRIGRVIKSRPEEVPMSRVNGEKARAHVARRNRTAQRVKDRARLAEIKAASAATAAAPKEEKASK